MAVYYAVSREVLRQLGLDSSPEVVLRAAAVAGPRKPEAGEAIGVTNALALATRHANTITLAAMICLNAIVYKGELKTE